MLKFFTAFAPLAERYDAFILDLWGVIHDGQTPYPGAKNCLEHLRKAGKKIVLLSNAPRRAAVAAESLKRMGMPESAYDALITSGETAYRTLGDPESAYFRATGPNYIYIGLERDRSVLSGLNYREVADPKEAHFIMLSHSYYDNQPESELASLIGRCLEFNLPAICINPDWEVVRQNGEHIYCAGVLAARYIELGGKVTYFGKPHPIVYHACRAALGDIELSRILAVGDSLATDIAGANGFGVESALITGGILQEKLGKPQDEGFQERLGELLGDVPAKPDYVLPAFNW